MLADCKRVAKSRDRASPVTQRSGKRNKTRHLHWRWNSSTTQEEESKCWEWVARQSRHRPQDHDEDPDQSLTEAWNTLIQTVLRKVINLCQRVSSILVKLAESSESVFNFCTCRTKMLVMKWNSIGCDGRKGSFDGLMLVGIHTLAGALVS